MLKTKCILLLLALAVTARAQQFGGRNMPDGGGGRPAQSSSAPKPYQDVITDKAITDAGMFAVHRVDDRYFFEIPDTLLGRDILIVNRVARAPEDLREIYGNDLIGGNVVRLEKGKNDKIFLRLILNTERADSLDTGMYRSVSNSSLHAILVNFAIRAYGGDSLGVRTSVIDVTDLVQGDNEILHFSAASKRNVGAFQSDKSYIESIKSFPINIEIHAVKTYTRGAPAQQRSGNMPAAAQNAMPTSSLPVTFELNSSLVLLPKVPMKPRYADPRVGYFTQEFNSFEDNAVASKSYIARWRLEPKDEAKYARGELTEPVKPIVFYIDPATPKKWVPYLIQGVNDWQVAFEAAGFKKAIYALEAPANDPSWSINDATHNVIVYKSSTIANASGPHVHDPRSGEIIETHVNWYHNIQDRLQTWYMLQAGMIDPAARMMRFDDELMGQLIRFVSSHEVGHTLGLRHNFGSSSTVPVEKLRDKAWVEKNGHTPSIMDYARFNYVAQAGDKIGRAGIFPRIGDYDKWAIEWGYKWFPRFATPDDEIPYLNQWIIERLKNPRLFFGHEMEAYDPRSQSEDLGDDPVLASRYGIQNLKAILPLLPEWTREANKDHGNLQKMYGELFSQYGRYAGHVVKVIGGKYHTPRTIEEAGPVYEPVPYEKQKNALKFLIDDLFQTPAWLLDESIMPDVSLDPVAQLGNIQSPVLSRLQSPAILMNITRDKQYDPFEYLDDLKQGIWTELYTNQPVDLPRRNLQRAYVANCAKELTAAAPAGNANQGPGQSSSQGQNDAAGIYRAHLTELLGDVVHATGKTGDRMTRAHLLDIQKRIGNALDPAR
jgi:hypothetical protein